MPSSYRVIKHHQVDIGPNDYEIPVVPADNLLNGDKDSRIRHRSMERIEKLVKNAQIQAKEVLQEAMRRAEQIKSEAYEQGYQEGFAQGENEGEKSAFERVNAEVNSMKDQAKELLNQAHKKSRDYIRRTKEEIIELSAEMAKNIIHYNINIRDENIVEMINNALMQAEGKRQIIIRCSPKHSLLLETNLYLFKKICPNAAFTILEDKSIEAMGCIVETEDQVLNLNIDLQLENIKQALLEMGNKNDN